MNSRVAATTAALVICWLVVFVGVLAEAWVIPTLAKELGSYYQEYSGSEGLIQGLLSAIVVGGQLVFALVAILLGKIRRGSLVDSKSLTWVSGLIVGLGVLGASFLALFGWLTAKNTMPPTVALALLLAILVVALLALVTSSLRQVLRDAIEARAELEGVI